MKLRKRERMVARAESELGNWLIEWRKRHDLSDAEYLQCLVEAMQLNLKWALRAERDPDE